MSYIDFIIAEFRERFVFDYTNTIDGSVSKKLNARELSIENLEQFLIQKLKEQEVMYEEAIGEDEEDSIDVGLGSGILEKEYARNKLRKQIRQAVKEAKGEV